MNHISADTLAPIGSIVIERGCGGRCRVHSVYGTSGFLCDGAARRTGRPPVLAPHQGWFAAMIPRFALGQTGDILNPDSLATALEHALERSDTFRASTALAMLTAEPRTVERSRK